MLQQPEDLQQQVRRPDVVFKDLSGTEHGSLQNDDCAFIDALLK